MSAYYTKNLGRYNWAGSEKDWCVQLFTPYGNVSETWPQDEEPHVDGLPPSEVLDLIEERLDSYWISTRRAEDKARIAKIREHMDEVDLLWAEWRLQLAERDVSKWRSMVDELRAAVARVGGGK